MVHHDMLLKVFSFFFACLLVTCLLFRVWHTENLYFGQTRRHELHHDDIQLFLQRFDEHRGYYELADYMKVKYPDDFEVTLAETPNIVG